MGVAGMLYEYALSALGNNLMGSSHEQIFVIIGLMMFAMGVGAAVQRRIGQPLIDRFLWIEIGLGVLGGLSGLVAFTAYGYMSSYPVVLYGLALAIGLLVGFEVPLLIRINESYAGALRANLGEILSMDYIGSLLGALLFAYVLLARLPLAEIAIAAGVVSVVIALAGVVYFWPLVKRPKTIAAFGAASLVVLTIAWVNAGPWVSYVEQRSYEDPIVHRETSVYQHVVMTRRDDRVRLYINGNLQFSSRDEVIYHDLLVHPAMHAVRSPRRVLILGGGDGLGLREVLKYPGVERVTLVDIDPAITGLAAEHPTMVELNRGAFRDARVRVVDAGSLSAGEAFRVERPSSLSAQLWSDRVVEGPEVRVAHIDADLFLREVDPSEPYDVVICDFPDARSVALAKLYSVEFYRRVERVLAPGGMVVVQSSSPWHASRVFRCIGTTLAEAGFEVAPFHQNVPSFGHWGWHMAWRAGEIEPPARRLASLDTLRVETGYATPAVLAAAFEFGEGLVDRTGEIRANTKMRPVILEYERRSWTR